MNEATVSAPFMKQLREELLICKVIKHHDASMIGLPDCSVTFQQRVWWLEFKFYPWKKKWDRVHEGVIVNEITDEAQTSKVQAAMLKDLSVCAAGAFYVIFLKKSGVYIIHPMTREFLAFDTAAQAATGMARIIRAARP